MKHEILTEVRQIKLLLGLNKKVLTLEEFCLYAGISKDYAYQLTAGNKVKFYRPFGKKIYIELEEVERLLTSNQVSDNQSSNQKANNYFFKKLK